MTTQRHVGSDTAKHPADEARSPAIGRMAATDLRYCC
jgi:hypothetical protein